MTNGTYTGQTDWRVGGVSKVYRSEVIPLSFEGRSKDGDRVGSAFDNLSIGQEDGKKLAKSKI